MSITKPNNYLVLNYSASPVCISTRHDSFLVNGGTPEDPGSLPLTFEEIAVINSKSPVFKIGLLRFEPSKQEQLYEALSIPNWRDILTDDQIAEVLTHPDIETSQKILDIDNPAYFERVRGVMIGLRNAGYDIPGKIERMIEQRRVEMSKGQRKTSIKLVAQEETPASHSEEDYAALKEQLESLQKMMAQFMQANSAQNASVPPSRPNNQHSRPNPEKATHKSGNKTR